MTARRICPLLATFGLLLGIHEGRIALWRDGSADPIQVFPYPVSSYPLRDQQLLSAGIPINSTSRLHSLLEDYLS